MEQQIDSYGAAQHLRQITGANGHFAHQPVGPARPIGIPVSAALGQVLPRDYSYARADYLHEDRDQARPPYDPSQSVLELRPGLQVRPPVASIPRATAGTDRRP